jgi:hypothetical protein
MALCAWKRRWKIAKVRMNLRSAYEDYALRFVLGLAFFVCFAGSAFLDVREDAKRLRVLPPEYF